MKDHFVVVVTTAPMLHEPTRELATRLAVGANAVLYFLHIVPLRRDDGEGMLHAAVDLAGSGAEAWLRRQRPAASNVRFRHRFLTGEPEELVAQFVAQHDVDYVVVEEPPRGKISELLWRGFAERLIRGLSCPVVIGGPRFLSAPGTPQVVTTAALPATTVSGLLNAMVDARVQSLRRWMDHAADSTERVVTSRTVQRFAQLAARDRRMVMGADVELLRVELDEHRQALRAVGWQLTVNDATWSNQMCEPLAGGAHAAFVERVNANGHSTSVPLPVDGPGDRVVILAGARVAAQGEGLLVFAFDAEEDFLRILGQPGPLPSFETYAFDGDGLMLSNSRFPDHLCKVGLLPAEDVQTPFKLRVAEPSPSPRADWPLTKMARRAVQNEDGSDTLGYLDYRGTSVVGAWRWLAEYGFGVAAEVDHEAAFP